MAVPVNPPPALRIPEQFSKDQEVLNFFEQQQVILYQLFRRTGGSEDFVEDNDTSTTSLSSRVSRNSAKINSLEKQAFDVIPITADYTTGRNQIIICKNITPIEVTLDANAIEEDTLHIKRRGGTVTVIGLIDGITDLVINVPLFSLHLIFDGQDWSQI